jgi:hypothetical protein
VFASACILATACSAPVEQDELADSSDELIESKHLGMTDVTILYPLPRTQEYYDDLMSPSSEGERGELFSPEVFDQLAAVKSPPMIGPDGKPVEVPRPLFSQWADQFANLRIVGIRLDPCFGETDNLGAATCQNTIRLVAQFVNPLSPTSADGRVGIHLFYTVTRAEFTALAKGMLALRRKARLPLQKGFVEFNAPQGSSVMSGFGVHPTLVNEGLRGPYAEGLRDLILSYAGSNNLTQVAFCVQDRGGGRNSYYGETTVMSESNRWAFGRFDVKQGTLYAQSVATLDFAGVQSSDIEPGWLGRADAKRTPLVVTPSAQTPDNYFARFNKVPQELDAAGWEGVSKAAFNFMNPRKYTARNSDCVSCHLADQATGLHPGTRNLFSNVNAYKSNIYRLNHTAPGASPFRMFGWSGSNNGASGPVISSRVANETAVVLTYINKSILK